MVNKIHFEKQIFVLRRKEGLSQVELAEKLGITSQAVSKLECGSAIPDIDLFLELSHLYNVSINGMLENIDMFLELIGQKTSLKGITYFVPE